MQIGISEIILFCASQTIGLLIILFQKKFQSAPNKILKIILVSLLAYYSYYYLFFNGNELQQFIPFFISFSFLSPPLIYFYCFSVINGRLPIFKEVFPHSFIFIVSFIWCHIITNYGSIETQNYTLKVLLITLGLLHIIYPLIIVYRLGHIYHLKGLKKLKVFLFNKEKTIMVKLFVTMMLIHAVLLNIKSILFLVQSKSWEILDISNIVFLLVLSYAIGFVIITHPTGIHLCNKKIGVTGFNKYNKSGLNEIKAKEISDKLNELFLSEKLYLDPSLSLTKVSKLIKEQPCQISETLNRLLGQSFNDYINNFRIEEFKELIKKPIYQNYSILALGYEVGFNSKATFNKAFKKFTNQTPSEYKEGFISKNQKRKEINKII